MGELARFLLHLRYKPQIDAMSDEDAGALFKAIYQYVDSGKMPNVDSDTVRIALGFICSQIDEDCEKYKACQREGRRKAQGK